MFGWWTPLLDEAWRRALRVREGSPQGSSLLYARSVGGGAAVMRGVRTRDGGSSEEAGAGGGRALAAPTTILSIPDFHFHVSFANLASTFDALIDLGLNACKALRRSTPHG